jgi:hypothetical protein
MRSYCVARFPIPEGRSTQPRASLPETRPRTRFRVGRTSLLALGLRIPATSGQITCPTIYNILNSLASQLALVQAYEAEAVP